MGRLALFFGGMSYVFVIKTITDWDFGQERIDHFGKVQREEERKEVNNMAKSNSEVTSAKAASAASKVLRNPKSSPAAKTAAASALTQRPNKK
ncbi:hypothetical protein [Neptunicoccus cionae]|uniref:Uncharacterized protein n=1 Tax=Neptunicoccus cionae TaxID=2035344 RepID=A0A916R499_9RHOB|nr:hypothetical protein [Amylibacter cionae]GGA33001.1 hypothetical protein GCM10011498_37790 [Amylibacter cionae]